MTIKDTRALSGPCLGFVKFWSRFVIRVKRWLRTAGPLPKFRVTAL
jgi:hypothetical protein